MIFSIVVKPTPHTVVAHHSAAKINNQVKSQPAVTPVALPEPQPVQQPETPAPTPAPAADPALVAPSYPSDHNEIMAEAGITPSDYGYVDYIVSRESGWCATKWQGETYCPDTYYEYDSLSNGWEGYGLCQSTPGIKMSSAGADFATNPVTQMSWCNAYAMSAYGSWYSAYVRWVNYHNW